MKHSDLTGTNLHFARSRISTGSPQGVESATVVGEICIDVTNNYIYQATATGLSGWVRLVAGNVLLSPTRWDDMRVPVTATKTGGSKDPTFEVLVNDGIASQGVFVYKFSDSQEKELYFTLQFDHGYKLGTDLEPHVHWAPTTAAPYAGLDTVRWGLEYTIANVDEQFPLTNTIYADCVATDQYVHQLNEFSQTIPGTGINSLSTMVLCRIFRDVANDNYANLAALLEIDFHYQIDTIGSSEEFIK